MTMSETKRAQLAQYWGVGTPLLERYANWLASVLQGDWGTSLRFNAPVMEVLGNRAANSLALLGIAWVASGVLGLLLSRLADTARAAYRQDALTDALHGDLLCVREGEKTLGTLLDEKREELMRRRSGSIDRISGMAASRRVFFEGSCSRSKYPYIIVISLRIVNNLF